MSDETMDTTNEATSGPAELRAALQRERERREALEAKLSDVAFKDAGFPSGTKERNALEKFFSGDRTDAAAIRKFAEEELGYKPTLTDEPAPAVEHVQPAGTVVADARSDLLDASALGDPLGNLNDASEFSKARDEHLRAAQDPNQDNASHINAAIAAELKRAGLAT